MAKNLDEKTLRAARAEARKLEQDSDSSASYPAGTKITRANRPSRMFNVRLTEEQFTQLQELARTKHLPVSTMARAWLLDRLDHERPAN
jgi:hypothetical protein